MKLQFARGGDWITGWDCGDGPDPSPLPEMTTGIGAHLDHRGNPRYRLVGGQIIRDDTYPVPPEVHESERRASVVSAIRAEYSVDDEIAEVRKALRAIADGEIKLPDTYVAQATRIEEIKAAQTAKDGVLRRHHG